MTRRDFLAGTLTLAGLSALPFAASAAHSANIMKPKALKPGSRIALPSPASAGSYAEDLAKCKALIEAWGWEPVEMKNAGSRFGYLAGTDIERAEDINSAFGDDSIDGIICIRGGYGTMRMLPLLDEKLIRRNPKVIMGFSDISGLLVGLNRRLGLVTFHGPNALSTDNPYSAEYLKKAVSSTEPIGSILNPDPLPGPAYELKTVAGGVGKGRIIGGNLTLLAHMMGTKWAPKLDDSLLFIEDVGEAPYRIDRMLTQFRIAGLFKKCRGVIVGQFTDCDEKAPDSEWKVADVVSDRLGDLGIPVVSGWAIGHVRPKATLPIGCMAVLDGDKKTLTVLESAVQP